MGRSGRAKPAPLLSFSKFFFSFFAAFLIQTPGRNCPHPARISLQPVNPARLNWVSGKSRTAKFCRRSENPKLVNRKTRAARRLRLWMQGKNALEQNAHNIRQNGGFND
jgi:hypothetical protein